MTIEVKITNLDESENPDKVAVVRTYHDKGNSVDDGVTLGPGESHTAYVYDESFVQIDEASNPDYAAPAPVYVEPEPVQTSDDDDVSGGGDDGAPDGTSTTAEDLEPVEDKNGNVMFDPQRVVSDEEAAAGLEDSEADDTEDDVDDEIDSILS